MATTTTNMALTKPDLTDTADVRVLNDNMDKLDGHRHAGGSDGLAVRAVQAGLLSARPGSGNVGQLYVATDVPALYIDNGSSWTQLQNSGAQLGEIEITANSNTVPNGTTTQFNIGTGVAASKVWVYVNGLLREENVDYTFVVGSTYVTFSWAPVSGDKVRMIYVAA